MNSIDARLSLRTSALLALIGMLAGCAGMSDAQCRGANWYDLGYRDARVKATATVAAKGSDVALALDVSEGPLHVIRSVEVTMSAIATRLATSTFCRSSHDGGIGLA